jgi:spermidine synthase
MFGATVYTFSLILGVFLFGLGIGSTIGAALARNSPHPRAALGWCQMLLCGALGWAALMLTTSLPYWPINPSISTNPWFNFQLDLLRCAWVVLPGAILWGASFPLALAGVAAPSQDPGRLVGGVYAANTVGAIVGALGASLIVTQTIGSQRGQQMFILASVAAALLMLVPAATAGTVRQGTRLITTVALLLATAGAGWLASAVPPVPGLLIAYGRYAVTWVGLTNIIYTGEGLNAFVAVTETSSGVRNYHNAGKVQASSEPQDMRLQRMLGHITTLLPETPGNILVIGCGAGVTAGAVSIDPGVQRLTIAEIEPLVPKFVAEHFGEHNFNVVRNPKTHIQIDDGRHFLLTTDETFDAITSDPFDPWVKGAATLYTEEFFNLAKSKLNDGGVMTVFVQLYESSMATVKSEIATFMKAFPNGVVFANTSFGQGYDVVLMGQKQPGPIDLDRIAARLSQPEYGPVAQSLYEIGIYSVEELFGTFAGDGPQLRPWLADAQINRDRNLRLQYLAGLGLNIYEADDIYRDMIVHRSWPQDLFVGSPERLAAIRDQIAGY